jgi:hypothetical protein
MEELMWLDYQPPENIKIGSVFKHEILPKLKEMGLIG